jgi:hypothetical protein
MKPLSILGAVLFALFTSSCADPLEKRSGEEVGSQIERGVTGQGQIGPIERSADDPANEHGVPQNHP